MVVTWNPTEKGTNITLSNGNLTASGIMQNSSVKSTESKTKGKWFCEIKIDTINYSYVAIAPSNVSMTSNIGTLATFYGYYFDGRKSNGGVVSAYGSAYTTGDIMGIFVDMDNGSITFYKNGVSQGVAFNGISNLSDFCIIATSGTVSSSTSVTANFGATPFAYPPDRTTLPFGVKSYDGSQVLSYEQGTMIKDSEAYKTYVKGKDAVESVNLIPKMTNDISPSPYVATASSSYSSWMPYYAFDQLFNGSSRWISGTVAPQWVKIDLGSPKKAYSYKLSAGHMEQQTASWILQGSNNNTDWTDLDTVTGNPLKVDAYTEFAIDTPSEYRYYRVYITEVYANGASAQALASLSGFALMTEFIPEEPSRWENVSTTLPTQQQFKDKGMDNLSILERKVTALEPIPMSNKTEILSGEAGLVFSANIDLKKYFDLQNIRTEVKK